MWRGLSACYFYQPVTTCPDAHLFRGAAALLPGLTEALVNLGFETDRLKTGTPARVDSRSVNFAGLEEQAGGSACSIVCI